MKAHLAAWSPRTLQLIRAAREEDLAEAGDITAALLETGQREAFAHVCAREPGVVCGLNLAPLVCDEFAAFVKQPITFTAWRTPAEAGAGSPSRRLHDGDAIKAGQIAAEVQGPRAALLAVERTLLNFLCRMSGVASLTRRFVDAARAANATVEILDTRKTLPGWRELDKYAVQCGGGVNHRFGLYDAVLLKDNHLAGMPTADLRSAIAGMLARLKPNEKPVFVQVEVDTLAQLREVCHVAGVNSVLLDNFKPADLREAVKLRDESGLRGKLLLEASGGVTLEDVAEIAATGVDRISIGALTHSAPALDLGLDFVS